MVGCVAYFIGTILFMFGAWLDVLSFEAPEVVRFWFGAVPNIIASSLFVVGGVCEVSHNRLFRGGATCRELVWWASLGNFLGGVLFVVGSLPGLVGSGWTPETSHAVGAWGMCIGSALYVASSVCLIFMW